MTSYKTSAIIIGRFNLGESDRILTLFSPEYGIIRAVTKGSRKSKSKFGGHTELFSYADFVISNGRSLNIITDVSLISSNMPNSPGMEDIKSAYYFAEIITKLLPEKEPHQEIFDLLKNCLVSTEQLGPQLTRLIFVAKILKALGIYPELDTCIKCGEKPNGERIYFSKSAGGITDDKCSSFFSDAQKTSADIIKFWRYIATKPFSSFSKLNIPKQVINEASDLAIEYIQCITMIDYRSLRVLS